MEQLALSELSYRRDIHTDGGKKYGHTDIQTDKVLCRAPENGLQWQILFCFIDVLCLVQCRTHLAGGQAAAC